VIDLGGVDYISSAGLKALAAAANLCAHAHGGLALCGLGEPVRIALDLGGMLADFPVEPSRDRAIARCQRGSNSPVRGSPQSADRSGPRIEP
jgi:anti-anti-sigma regulatory factor